MGGHARHGQALLGPHPRRLVGPAAPVRVGHDGRPAHLVEGDVLGRMTGRPGDADRREDPLGIVRRPLKGLHPTHGGADDGEQGLDPQGLHQHGLGPDHVGDGDHREGQAPGRAGRRIAGAGARRAHAAAQDIGADDEEAIGVQGQAAPHHPGPPARLARHRVGGGQVLVAGQGVHHQDGVRPVGVEPAIGAVGHLEGRQGRARIQPERPVGGEPPDAAAGLNSVMCRQESLHRPAWTVCPFRCQPLRTGRWCGYEQAARDLERAWTG